jgi:hypothetical protein
MKSTTKIIKTDGRCIVEAETTIEGILHKVSQKYVKCNPSLNSRAWGVTEIKSKCELCFPVRSSGAVQLTLF